MFLRQVGRPSLDIEIEDIEFLRSLRFSLTAIAEILKVSRSTIYRRMEEYGVPFDKYSNISDRVLDEIMTDIKQHHPNDGEKVILHDKT